MFTDGGYARPIKSLHSEYSAKNRHYSKNHLTSKVLCMQRYRIALFFGCVELLCFNAYVANCRGQSPNINSQLWSAPAPFDATPGNLPGFQFWSGSYGVVPVGASVQAALRAAPYFDTARLSDSARPAFLPSAIPAPGEPYFNSGSQGSLAVTGTSLTVLAEAKPSFGGGNEAYDAKVQTTIAPNSFGGPGLKESYFQLDGLVIGTCESAFADAGALPETIDLAGPNGRVTVIDPSTQTANQGRLSEFIYFSGDKNRGLIGDVSIETPNPEVLTTNGSNTTSATTKNFDGFSRFPDFIATLKVGDGQPGKTGTDYDEFYHLQLGGVIRSIGLESDNRAVFGEHVGWGVQISGLYTIPVNPSSSYRDSIVFSVTDGDGIARYITDLHVASMFLKFGGNDAALNSSGKVVLLSDLAYYAGYRHFWSDHYRTTITYSHVELGSVAPPKASPPGTSLTFPFASPYRRGDYAAVNLIYEDKIPVTFTAGSPTGNVVYFNAGIEYIYGEKQDLNGAVGQDQRLMLMVQLSK
jgi:hypothetical protein